MKITLALLITSPLLAQSAVELHTHPALPGSGYP